MRAKRRCFFDGGHATQQDTYLIESALSRNKTAERLLCGLSDAVSFVLVCAHLDHFQSAFGRPLVMHVMGYGGSVVAYGEPRERLCCWTVHELGRSPCVK